MSYVSEWMAFFCATQDGERMVDLCQTVFRRNATHCISPYAIDLCVCVSVCVSVCLCVCRVCERHETV